MENLAKQVDQEKRNAIIVSNKLASLSSKTEEKIAMLQVSCSASKLKDLNY
jgi:hypothetical protein